MAAHSLAPAPSVAAAAPAPPTASKRHLCSSPPVVRFEVQHQRRAFLYGLVGAGLGSAVCGGGDANAAGRRPPPPPPKEKKDLNMSPLQAKILASVKRKEAMKEAMAQFRQKGKPIVEPPK
ncbi:unnamed protein product [Spirodela intermedia]|uniref:Uncharacterized protein n=2 Tax=Spirodela intermedia TaxID=51605 RepID=A0A7I8L4J5_SPIIN|nr:unnamed protein product [Spirodela intermedia]CAA6667746.1 unnamed protein product [Spirodela intermedia]CAA7404556.1 unnamed protein product [Spirodela intermedia]